MSIGEWLDDALDALDLTQEEFGEMIGAGQSTVSNWVRNVRVPRERTCARIARALGVDVDEVRERAGYERRSSQRPPRPARDFHDPLFQAMRAGGLYWPEEYIREVIERAKTQDLDRDE